MNNRPSRIARVLRKSDRSPNRIEEGESLYQVNVGTEFQIDRLEIDRDSVTVIGLRFSTPVSEKRNDHGFSWKRAVFWFLLAIVTIPSTAIALSGDDTVKKLVLDSVTEIVVSVVKATKSVK